MARKNVERKDIDVRAWEGRDENTEPEPDGPEPFVCLIKRIIETLVQRFQDGEATLLPTISEFMKIVQLYCEIQEDEIPSEVEVIWRDPFAPDQHKRNAKLFRSAFAEFISQVSGEVQRVFRTDWLWQKSGTLLGSVSK